MKRVRRGVSRDLPPSLPRFFSSPPAPPRMMMRPTPAKQRSEDVVGASARKLMYARAASLPPVPIRPRSRENAIEAAASAYGHEAAAGASSGVPRGLPRAHSHSQADGDGPGSRAASHGQAARTRHGSEPQSAVARTPSGGVRERERERSLGAVDTVASSKAQRLLGALQLDEPAPGRRAKPRTPKRSFAYSDVSGDSDDGASFVDFGNDVDEPARPTATSGQNQRRPLSITSFDSGIPAFAPPSPTRERRRSPPSPTAFIRTFSSSAAALMSAPPSSTAVTSSKPTAVPGTAATSTTRRPPNSATPPPTEPLPLPPTINMLSNTDRADLLRKHRKLAQLLGDSVATAHPFATAEPVDGPWPPERDTVYMSAAGRRHSSPLSPSSQFDFLRSIDESASLTTMAKKHTGRSSPTSFVDMDDDDKPPAANSDAISIASSVRSGIDADDTTPPTPKAKARKGTFSSSYSVDSISSASTSSPPQRRTHRARSISVDVVSSPPGSPGWVLVGQGGVSRPHVPALSDEERRRKRAKLVKLHRFLGSRVPTDLVLGLPPPTTDLPPVAQGLSPVEDDSRDGLKGWIRRKRGSGSGSGAASPVAAAADQEDSPLNATELGDRERMINVKRAQKMEKLFGAQPPQTLFHTRTAIPGQRPYGSTGTVRSPAGMTTSRSASGLPASAPSSPRHSALHLPPTQHARPWSRSNSVQRGRPSTSESSQGLLRASMEEQEAQFAFGSEEDATTPMAPRPPPTGSPEFRHYQQSLSSLGAIIDRGDRESLMELFDFVNEDGSSEEEAQQALPSTSASERRRSLPPTRASVSSASSIMSSSPSADSSFGLRRRRAAKLAHFFGVSYRDLVGDVLDSIEMGVRDEASKGSMKPDEVQELITRLQILKNRGTDLDSRLQRTR
ncbi:hypothetical protein AURDEDRAFT_181706 [Auricularia subglabra TFB-10046 SS5]|nr:hypothetical protein AURDEDRAFT_181706 [Auricularia subglabra TFB-10046 SS5]